MNAAKTVRGRTVRTCGAAAALAVAGALAFGACGGSSGSTSSSTPASSGTSSSAAPGGTPAGSVGASGDGSGAGPKTSLGKAGAAAVKKVAGGTLISIELERHGTVWEAQVAAKDGTEHKVNVSASTGSVTSTHAEHEGAADRAKHRTRIADAQVDYADAANKARATVPGGRVTELNLDGYRGRTVWEADVKDRSGVKHEVKLDAANGDVLVDHPSTGDDD